MERSQSKCIFPEMDIQSDGVHAGVLTYIRVKRLSDGVWFLVPLNTRWQITDDYTMLDGVQSAIYQAYKISKLWIVPEDGKFLINYMGHTIGGEKDDLQISEEERLRKD